MRYPFGIAGVVMATSWVIAGGRWIIDRAVIGFESSIDNNQTHWRFNQAALLMRAAL